MRPHPRQAKVLRTQQVDKAHSHLLPRARPKQTPAAIRHGRTTGGRGRTDRQDREFRGAPNGELTDFRNHSRSATETGNGGYHEECDKDIEQGRTRHHKLEAVEG